MLPKIDKNVVDPSTTRYKRTHNTAVSSTEERLCSLYGAWQTILCNSGMEAVNTALALIHPQTVIVDDETYFETRAYWRWMGCTMHQIRDLNDTAALDTLLCGVKGPVLICTDSPSTFGNWKNVPEISCVAHAHGAYLMIDNSVSSLYYNSPIKDGADICVESYTKYVCGYGDCFAGGIALSESMQWLEEKPVPPPDSGLDYIQWVISRRGNVVPPETAYAVSRGLETLAVRMEQHTSSAQSIYKALRAAGVNALYSGVGGLITLPGKGEDFCRKLKKIVTVGTFGCTYSNSDFFRNDTYYAGGVCARISVGLEDPRLIFDDIAQALSLAPEVVYG